MKLFQEGGDPSSGFGAYFSKPHPFFPYGRLVPLSLPSKTLVAPMHTGLLLSRVPSTMTVFVSSETSPRCPPHPCA